MLEVNCAAASHLLVATECGCFRGGGHL